MSEGSRSTIFRLVGRQVPAAAHAPGVRPLAVRFFAADPWGNRLEFVAPKA